MKKILLFAGLLAVIGQVRAQQNPHHPSHPSHSVKKKSPVAPKKYPAHFGTASYYANKFEGRKTACGEIFSQKKLSAASNIIPMNNWVRITNLRNKRTVILRINDRMHPRNPRLIDLSRAAAHQLNYTGRGIVRVKVEVLGTRLPKGLVKS